MIPVLMILVTTHLLKITLGKPHCNTDLMMDGLPSAPSNNANDASRLDLSVAVQLKRSGELTDAVKYDF